MVFMFMIFCLEMDGIGRGTEMEGGQWDRRWNDEEHGQVVITVPKAVDSQKRGGSSQLFPMFVILCLEMDGFG